MKREAVDVVTWGEIFVTRKQGGGGGYFKKIIFNMYHHFREPP